MIIERCLIVLIIYYQLQTMQKIIDLISSGKSELNLKLSKISDFDMKFLCSQKTHEIQRLILRWNKITCLGMAQLSKASWSCLIMLDIRNRKITRDHNLVEAKGCKYLTRASMHSLQQLNLSFNVIENEGLLHLSKGKWSNLQALKLTSTKIREKGVAYLVRGNWMNLSIISIYQNDLELCQIVGLALSLSVAIQRIYYQAYQIGRPIYDGIEAQQLQIEGY